MANNATMEMGILCTADCVVILVLISEKSFSAAVRNRRIDLSLCGIHID
jgi:hypothetical protein